MSLKNRLFGLSKIKLMFSDAVDELLRALALKKALFQKTWKLKRGRMMAATRLGEL